uniref:U1-type domain-containing protein n=1 Tax=Amazona collaria TaxID=241587 RepID=A0A8B9FKR5_9PSIT
NRSGDLFTDTFCKVCKAVLQFESERTSHYKGKKHAQKVHIYLQVHGDKKQKKTDGIDFQSEVVDQYKYCSLCNTLFTSPVDALSHYFGKMHAKNIKEFPKEAHMPAQAVGAGYYICSVFNKSFVTILKVFRFKLFH